ncbi:hypothetical protein [Chamaesiphon sp. VAR_48_metabat_403]|uniref:hypothetical protein n=1 Tax=Chamaesiphon sp. VAR_48_metabat_403 TaxID=2964700 RepID=UPI00286E75DD|nr:hypothetical protein [Chamaesiphon sp. VAR_48_metabat_403]
MTTLKRIECLQSQLLETMYYKCGTSDRQERPDRQLYGNRSATGRGGWIQKPRI